MVTKGDELFMAFGVMGRCRLLPARLYGHIPACLKLFIHFQAASCSPRATCRSCCERCIACCVARPKQPYSRGARADVVRRLAGRTPLRSPKQHAYVDQPPAGLPARTSRELTGPHLSLRRMDPIARSSSRVPPAECAGCTAALHLCRHARCCECGA